jgi:hypothetical protein
MLHHLCHLFLFGLMATAYSAERMPIRVLFVGNSYTFHNQLPELFHAVTSSGGKWEPKIHEITDGGMRLFEHVERGEVSRALKAAAVAQQPWDVVILQEQSVVTSLDQASQGLDFREKFHQAAVQLSKEAHQANPEVLIVLFQTWARHEKLFTTESPFLANGKDPAEMMTRIHENYAAAAAAINKAIPRQRSIAVVSPVGDFWALALKTPGTPALHSEDGSHPSPSGSWFTALALTGTVFGRSSIEGASWSGPVSIPEATLLKQIFLDNPQIFHKAAE